MLSSRAHSLTLLLYNQVVIVIVIFVTYFKLTYHYYKSHKQLLSCQTPHTFITVR
jgi:hypothetical protein